MKRIGNAQTYLSKAVTDRFWIVDRAMFALSPYLTFDEAEKIAIELERMATSRFEGNFTHEDAFNWLAQQLGADRYAAVTQCWNIDNQQAITRLHSPEELRDAYVHVISMQEGTLEEVAANPKNYIKIQTTRSQYQA
jgi:hypothetical protein